MNFISLVGKVIEANSVWFRIWVETEYGGLGIKTYYDRNQIDGLLKKNDIVGLNGALLMNLQLEEKYFIKANKVMVIQKFNPEKYN